MWKPDLIRHGDVWARVEPGEDLDMIEGMMEEALGAGLDPLKYVEDLTWDPVSRTTSIQILPWRPIFNRSKPVLETSGGSVVRREL